MGFEDRALADAVVFIALGTVLMTYAVLLLADRNPDRRLPWTSRGARDQLVDVNVTNTLQAVAIIALVWGGGGLGRFVGTPLAVVIAIVPSLLLRLVVRALHHRRLAIRAVDDDAVQGSRWRR